MSEAQFNPSQQVERIREILIGREMGRIERRLSHLEKPQSTSFGSGISAQMATTHQSLIRETQQLRQNLQQEAVVRQQQISQLARRLNESAGAQTDGSASEAQLRERITAMSNEMTALIDARSREILHHLQAEILQWKNQMDRDLQSIRDIKADRKEIRSRFARMAAAAMEDEPEFETPDGYLL